MNVFESLELAQKNYDAVIAERNEKGSSVELNKAEREAYRQLAYATARVANARTHIGF